MPSEMVRRGEEHRLTRRRKGDGRAGVSSYVRRRLLGSGLNNKTTCSHGFTRSVTIYSNANIWEIR